MRVSMFVPARAADQYDASTLTKDELTALLRGPAGSTVEMWVGGALAKGLPRRVELERRPLPQPAVKQVDVHLVYTACRCSPFVWRLARSIGGVAMLHDPYAAWTYDVLSVSMRLGHGHEQSKASPLLRTCRWHLA